MIRQQYQETILSRSVMLWSVQWCDLLVYRVWILLEYEYEFLIASKLLCNTLESCLSELVAETLRVNVWYPLVPTAYASLLVSVTCCGCFASFCAHFGSSVVASGCEVLQLDFYRFWRLYATGQISGFYNNGVMV